MKEKFLRLTKWLSMAVVAIALTLALGLGVAAEEVNLPENTNVGGEYTENLPDLSEEGGETEINIFEEIYSAAEANADKIFSILAFLGTLVVGVGYKSGLLPLLRDALSKLKSAIDGVKADGEMSKAMTESKMAEISNFVKESNEKLRGIEERLGNYEMSMEERESMRLILASQVDMLYAIFMSSALPQYQKDEIGIKIQEMREELASYENPVEN